MKWFIVVLSLVALNPEGDRDMWILKKIYHSVDHCVYDANIQALGLIAQAHNEFNYSSKYPDLQPWDAWTIKCVDEHDLEEAIVEQKEELKI